MKDNYGDKISVSVARTGGYSAIYLAVTDHHDDSPTNASLTPKKARKLAQKLRRAADEADGGAQVTFDDVKESFLPASYYMLDLTQAEAETLAVILYKVGGPNGAIEGTRSSARVHADTLADKLASLGLDRESLAKSDRYQTEPYSAIYFEGRA